VSNNLDKKTSEYMNLIIQNESGGGALKRVVGLNIENVQQQQYTRTMNTFQRVMKRVRKAKSLGKVINSSFCSREAATTQRILPESMNTEPPPLVKNLSLKTSKTSESGFASRPYMHKNKISI
jgi:hypothetical protein